MYDPKTADENYDFKEHFETTYYLKYNIEKAIYSLDKIMKSEIDYSEFSSECTYYHFYIDNLLNSVGHIRRRFFNENIEKDRIERNRKEYNYNFIDEHGKAKCNYPMIGNNNIRNFIEHIDEKDEALMKENIYYGCFNVIYKGMNQQLEKELLNDEKRQNNLLNLVTKEYKILTIKEEKVKEYKINLVELRKELEELKDINNRIWDILTNPIFR